MAVDNISELLGDQPLVDENQLPDSGTTDADIDSAGDTTEVDQQQAQQEPAEQGAKPRVPLSALQEERQRRQELQEQLRQQSELNQKMQERFQQMMERFQQPPAQQDQQSQQEVQIPAFNEDPEGHLNGLRQAFEQRLAQQEQVIQQFQQYFSGQSNQQQLASRVMAEESEFIKAQPDYQAAADFFTSRKVAEYAALGLDQSAVQMQLQRDLAALAQHAHSAGKSAPQVLYNLATALGYTPQHPQQGARPAQGAQPKPPTSLSNMSGTARSPEEQHGLSLESVANMSDAEFDKFWKDMERGSRQRPKI